MMSNNYIRNYKEKSRKIRIISILAYFQILDSFDPLLGLNLIKNENTVFMLSGEEKILENSANSDLIFLH